MGDRCSVWGRVFVPSLIAVMNVKPNAKFFECFEIERKSLPDLCRRNLVLEYGGHDINYAAQGIVLEAARAGLVGIVNNSPSGNAYGEGTAVMTGGDIAYYKFEHLEQAARKLVQDGIMTSAGADRLMEESGGDVQNLVRLIRRTLHRLEYSNTKAWFAAFRDQHKATVQQIQSVTKALDELYAKPDLPHPSVWGRLQPLFRICPETVEQTLACAPEIFDMAPESEAVFRALTTRSASALYLRNCRKPAPANLERLIRAVLEDTTGVLAAEVLQARQDIQDRRLALAATGIGGRDR